MKKHPNKEIQKALDYAVANGWMIVKAGDSAHAFCRIKCGIAGHTEHMHSIWSTPKNPENFAKSIIRSVKKCAPGKQQNDG